MGKAVVYRLRQAFFPMQMIFWEQVINYESIIFEIYELILLIKADEYKYEKKNQIHRNSTCEAIRNALLS